MIKFLFLILIGFLSFPAFSHNSNYEGFILIAAALYFLPLVLGLLIIGKGNRKWFVFISLLVYLISIAMGVLLTSFLYVFMPFILLLVAFIFYLDRNCRFNTNLDKHRKILSYLFMIVGVLFLLLSFRLASGLIISLLGVCISVSMAICGLSLLRNKAFSFKLATILATVSLVIFPIGSILGMYYLWFYHRYKENLKSIIADDTAVTSV